MSESFETRPEQPDEPDLRRQAPRDRAGLPVEDSWLDVPPDNDFDERLERLRERERRRPAPRPRRPPLSERIGGLLPSSGGLAALRRSRVAPTAAVAVAALIAFIVWLAVGSGGGSKGPASTSSGQAVAMSLDELKTAATAAHAPIYWVGTKPNTTYELTQTPDGKFLVRYLPKGTKAGTAGLFLTVGTYPLRNAYSISKAAARDRSAFPIPIGNNGVAFYGRARPTSVYLAYPGQDYQMEVFSPSARLAHRLASRGQVTPVPGSLAPPSVKALSATGLRAYAATVQEPIYWSGPRRGVTYELTRKADGSTLVRYLPSGVELGDPGLYPTIGTYPIPNAFAVTKGAAVAPGAVAIKLGKGGIALYNGGRPTNVYFSYPSSPVQVEVFNPSATEARRLVISGQVIPVR